MGVKSIHRWWYNNDEKIYPANRFTLTFSITYIHTYHLYVPCFVLAGGGGCLFCVFVRVEDQYIATYISSYEHEPYCVLYVYDC